MHGCQKDTIINEGYTVLNNLPVNRFQCPSSQGFINTIYYENWYLAKFHNFYQTMDIPQYIDVIIE